MMNVNFFRGLMAVCALSVMSFATSAFAAQLAYEGFDVAGATDGQVLAGTGTGASSVGFAGPWRNSSGAGGASSWQAAGLSYPGSYVGTNTPVAGHVRATGTASVNAFNALNLTSILNSGTAPNIYISWLAQNVAKPTALDAGTRGAFNLAAEYPRNSGMRIMTAASGNSALGSIGNSGDWNAGGQSVYGDAELNPEVVDTWGAFNFNDVHNIFTGNAGTKAAAGSAFYNALPDNYKGVDHLVLSINTATSAYRLQVNPQPNNTNDGELNWIHTDGAVKPFVMGGWGVEAGNGSSDREPGDMVMDEIIIATSFAEAAGFNQIPEPTSALLMVVCGLFGLGRRRS